MKPAARLTLAALVPALVAALASTPARALDPAITLSHGDIFNDPIGAMVGVTVTNGTNATINSAVITCAFTDKGKAVGSSSTTVYNIVAGDKGQDQVRLMGASADGTSCTITSTN